ncbi:hypothetical protein Avbf_04599 [Armadillidium vulgare]|nr:hypothetical protein Avbf_04599 [Armadillidium vulgare]
MSLINFQSSTEIKNKKQFEREARQSILDKAKEDYERKERRDKEAHERGETTWMLPSLIKLI